MQSMHLNHTPLERIISFPSSRPSYKVCAHDTHEIFNFSERNPGLAPGYSSSVEGVFFQLVAEALDLNFDIYVPDDDKWGIPDKDNIWTGCPGMIQRKEVDMATGGMLQSYFSFQFSHVSFMYRDSDVYFVTKIPNTSHDPYTIFKCFDVSVWIAIFVSALLVAVLYYFIMGRENSLADHIFSRFAEILLQEPSTKITNDVVSQEIITLFWAITVQFLTLSYIAVILMMILVPKSDPPLDTDDKILEAIKSGKYTATVPDYLPMYLDNLLTNPKPGFREIGEIIRDNNWLSHVTKENFPQLLRKNIAIPCATYTIGMYNPLGNPIVLGIDPVYFARLSYLTRKEFPFNKKLDNKLMHIFEAGLYLKLYEHEIFKARLKDAVHEGETMNQGVEVLSLVHLQGPFYLLIIGYIVSIIVLGIERIYYKYDKDPLNLKAKNLSKNFTGEINVPEDEEGPPIEFFMTKQPNTAN